MTTLHIDFETRSVIDLRKVGVHRYATDPSTEVLCAAYCVDDGPIEVWVPDTKFCPTLIEMAVVEGWIILAHNAQFERVMWRDCLGPKYGVPVPKAEQFRCTMAMAAAMSLPQGLDMLAMALDLQHRKDKVGYGNMLRMCKPRAPRKGEDPNVIHWFDEPHRFQMLYDYCKQDVVVEREIEKRLRPLGERELRLWQLDQRINDRGVMVDAELCNKMLAIIDQAAERLNGELDRITGGYATAASQVARLTEWLSVECDVITDSLDKDHVEELLLDQSLPKEARRALEIRQEASSGAVLKIQALLNGMGPDGRARGLLQYHAAQSGRWAGRRFQPHNLKRPDLKDIDTAVEALMTGDDELVSMIYGESLAVVGDCLRQCLVAGNG